jgi:hypothetical protein
MKLDKKTLAYFEKQHKKYDRPVCVIYIDAHGGETMEDNCSKDSATVFSFAGVSGSVAYAVDFEKNGKRIPGSLHYRDIISEILSPKSSSRSSPRSSTRSSPRNTKTIKKKISEITDVIRPQVKEHSKNAKPSHVQKWSKSHFDKHSLVPMKQMNQKRFLFYESDLKIINRFDFGIHVIDIVYPPDYPPDERLESLRGQNLITRQFDEEMFPEARDYLSSS